MDIVNETGEEVAVKVEEATAPTPTGALGIVGGPMPGRQAPKDEAPVPTREEVLEGLREASRDYGVPASSLITKGRAAIEAAIAYLEGLPTPGRIWVNLDEAGFHADMFDRKNLDEIALDDRAAFLRAIGGL